MLILHPMMSALCFNYHSHKNVIFSQKVLGGRLSNGGRDVHRQTERQLLHLHLRPQLRRPQRLLHHLESARYSCSTNWQPVSVSTQSEVNYIFCSQNRQVQKEGGGGGVVSVMVLLRLMLFLLSSPFTLIVRDCVVSLFLPFVRIK